MAGAKPSGSTSAEAEVGREAEFFLRPFEGADVSVSVIGKLHPGDFLGSELRRTPERFTFRLDAATIDGLDRLLHSGTAGPAFADRSRELLAEASRSALAALARGCGFILIKGLPVAGATPASIEALFRAMGDALGSAVQQNLDGDTLTHVRDEGDDPENPEVRLYRTRAAQDFHTDGADVIGLLCLRGAREGGASRIVSSVRAFASLKETRPDLAKALLEPWFFHLPGGKERGLPEAFPRPIVTVTGAKIETFFIPWYLERAQELSTVPRWTAEHVEAFRLYSQIIHDPALSLTMDFEPGDVQWLRNAYVLHARSAYEDELDPTRRRHLLRLWLSSPDLEDRTPRFEELGGG